MCDLHILMTFYRTAVLKNKIIVRNPRGSRQWGEKEKFNGENCLKVKTAHTTVVLWETDLGVLGVAKTIVVFNRCKS